MERNCHWVTIVCVNQKRHQQSYYKGSDIGLADIAQRVEAGNELQHDQLNDTMQDVCYDE